MLFSKFNFKFPLGRGGAAPYYQQVLNLFGSAIVAYWPLNDTSGTQATDISGNARHGTYSGATLNNDTAIDGQPCPTFDGNDLVNLFSTSFRDAFNANEGMLSAHFKMDAAATWLDGAAHTIVRLGPSGADTNQILLNKIATNNNLVGNYRAAGASNSRSMTGQSSLDWMNIIITWSQSGDVVKVYLNGSDGGLTISTIEDWTGVLTTGNCNAGAFINGVQHWKGSLAHIVVANRPATPAEVAIIASPFDYSISPRVMVVFDDEYASAYTAAFPIMQARGIKGTMYVCSDNIGQPGYMTAEQLLEMQAAGWSIGNHSKTHTNFTTLTQAEIEAEISQAKAALDAAGLTSASDHVAYPQGGFDLDTINAMTAQAMLTGRETSTAVLFTPQTVGRYQLPCNEVVASTAPATVTGWIDSAISQRKIVPFFFHELVASGPSTYQYTIANFTTIMDYIATKSAQIQAINVNDYNDL